MRSIYRQKHAISRCLLNIPPKLGFEVPRAIGFSEMVPDRREGVLRIRFDFLSTYAKARRGIISYSSADTHTCPHVGCTYLHTSKYPNRICFGRRRGDKNKYLNPWSYHFYPTCVNGVFFVCGNVYQDAFTSVLLLRCVAVAWKSVAVD